MKMQTWERWAVLVEKKKNGGDQESGFVDDYTTAANIEEREKCCEGASRGPWHQKQSERVLRNSDI